MQELGFTEQEFLLWLQDNPEELAPNVSKEERMKHFLGETVASDDYRSISFRAGMVTIQSYGVRKWSYELPDWAKHYLQEQ